MDCKDALTTEPLSGVCVRVLCTPRDAPCVQRVSHLQTAITLLKVERGGIVGIRRAYSFDV